jgi:hypothetical protein
MLSNLLGPMDSGITTSRLAKGTMGKAPSFKVSASDFFNGGDLEK